MAPSASSAPSLISFGVFELDLVARELRKNGRKLKIEGQPLQILQFLLERPGHVVTREELQQQLWPSDTFVDFEQGINSAIKRLRQALDDSAETPRFIETLPRRGYRFIYPLNGGAVAVNPPVRAIRRRWIAVLPLLGAAAVTAMLIWLNVAGVQNGWSGSPPAPSISLVAVLPFENLTGDAEQEYRADQIQGELITDLAHVDALTVIPRTSVRRYKQEHLKSVPEMGRELGVDAVVEGAVQLNGDGVRVNVQVTLAASDHLRWARVYDRDLRALSLLSKEIATDIASALRITLTRQDQAALAPSRPIEPAVYMAYSKGTHHLEEWTNASLWQAIRDFQQALELDPAYAPAWAGTGAAYEFLGTFALGKELSREDALARAKSALQRAVDLDPTSRSPHQALARIKRGEGDWQGSAREFQRAREVDPKWLGPETYLRATGRYDEAVAASRHDAKTDPFNYSAQLGLGYTYFFTGRYDESITQLRKTIRLDPANYNGHYELAWNYIKKGMLNEAVAECDAALALRRNKQPETLFVVQCGWVYAAGGRRRQALEIAGRVLASQGSGATIAAPMGQEHHGFLVLARIYDALGDRERALEYLRRSDDSAVPLRDDPMFSDELKADPRFQELACTRPGYPPPTGALAEVRAKAPRVGEGREP